MLSFNETKALTAIPLENLEVGTIHCPVNSSDMPTTAASATPWYITNAASISAVLKRWPDTLTTSSTRPRIQ